MVLVDWVWSWCLNVGGWDDFDFVCEVDSVMVVEFLLFKEFCISDFCINECICVFEVCFVGFVGEQIGVVCIEVVLCFVQEVDFDFVEVVLNLKLFVVKIMDYGKFKYEVVQKEKEVCCNQVNMIFKEVCF